MVVDGKTLSSADYTFNLFGPEAHLLRITSVAAANVPNAASQNVVVSYKFTEFDGSLFGSSIPTPFGTVTATSGPTFATQQAIPVVSATSLAGFTDPPGSVRLSTFDLSTVVKISFEYDAIDRVTEIATVSTPTAIGANKARRPTGIKTGLNSNTFTFKVALLTIAEINTIDTTIAGLFPPNDTVAGLVAALPATGGFNAKINTVATNSVVGLGLLGTSPASAFADLLVPIRNGETLTVSYTDANPAAVITKEAAIDLTPPTITLDQPQDRGFAGSFATIQVTIADAGAGLRLVDVVDNLRTNPQVIGNIVESSTLASAAQYSLSQTPIAAAPIPEGNTRLWVGDTPASGVVRDAVGNEPRGSGAALASDTTSGTRGTSGNPFEFRVDQSPPTLLSARTGGKPETDPTSPRVNEIVADRTARNAITVEFDLGGGGAPIDPASVSSGDFQVTGDGIAFPVIEVIVGATLSGDPTRQNLLLRLEEELPTGAHPDVRLAGSISDLAGNTLANVSVLPQNVIDGLAPVVTAAITGDAHSRPISRDEVVITVTGSEPGTITGTARYVAGSGDQTLGEDTGPGTAACGRAVCSKTLSFTSTGTNSWTSTVKINSITSVAVASGLVNVRIVVTDFSGNAGAAGLADPDGTFPRATAVMDPRALVFEFDNLLNGGVSDPEKIFVLSPETGTPADHRTDNSNPFITVEFKD